MRYLYLLQTDINQLSCVVHCPCIHLRPFISMYCPQLQSRLSFWSATGRSSNQSRTTDGQEVHTIITSARALWASLRCLHATNFFPTAFFVSGVCYRYDKALMSVACTNNRGEICAKRIIGKPVFFFEVTLQVLSCARGRDCAAGRHWPTRVNLILKRSELKWMG